MTDLSENLIRARVAGLELGRTSLKLLILDRSEGIVSFDEVPYEPGFDPSTSNLAGIAPALKSLWERLELPAGLRLGVALGSKYSGVGSGPTMHSWLDTLEAKLGQPVARVGSPNTGISYLPLQFVEQLRRVTSIVGADLVMVEVAPVSLARITDKIDTYSLSFSSSVAWQARVSSGHVLEAVSGSTLIDTPLTVLDVDGNSIEFKDVVSGEVFDQVSEAGFQLDNLAIARGVAEGVSDGVYGSNLSGVLDVREVAAARRRSVLAVPAGTHSATADTTANAVVDLDPYIAQNSLATSDVSFGYREDNSVATYTDNYADTSWPVSGEHKVVADQPAIPGMGYKLANQDDVVIDLTDSKRAAPGVPPASHQLPTGTELHAHSVATNAMPVATKVSESGVDYPDYSQTWSPVYKTAPQSTGLGLPSLSEGWVNFVGGNKLVGDTKSDDQLIRMMMIGIGALLFVFIMLLAFR